MERRSLLKILTGAVSTALAATVAAPILAVLGHPLRRRAVEAGLLPVADLESLPEGVPTRAAVIAPSLVDAWTRFEKVALGAVWLVRRGGEVRALSTTCPHAGCFVDWEARAGRFACPCHASAFDLDGKTVAGPAPRPMDALEVEVRDGRVLVRFQRFRQARSDKTPV